MPDKKNKKYDIKKRSYNFSLMIIRLLAKLPRTYIYQVIGRQLLRSATSIGANVIEAQAASSKNDFKNFINHALKSANETKYWLSLLEDGLKLADIGIGELLIEANELAMILGASMLKLKGRKF